MSRKIDSRAWDILLEDEKTSITLATGLNKSSWEAGEVMGKAHYKYLEIQKRSEKYLKMFIEHFEKHDAIIPSGVDLGLYFEQYIKMLIEKRFKIREVIKKMAKTPYKVSQYRTNDIIEEMNKLKSNKDEAHQDLYNLIMDFDRWNNFRILPRDIQEPSAFKRRNKVRNLKHLELSLSIPWISGRNIVKNYNYTGKFKKYFAVLVCKDHEEEDYVIIHLDSRKKGELKEITEMFLFYFENIKDATEFADILTSFPKRGKRNCKQGLLFWPKFRIASEKALNYNELNNIIPSRKNQDRAFQNFDRKMVHSWEKKDKQDV